MDYDHNFPRLLHLTADFDGAIVWRIEFDMKKIIIRTAITVTLSPFIIAGFVFMYVGIGFTAGMLLAEAFNEWINK